MQDNRSFFTKVFTALMIFSFLVGVCSVAFITAWPWEKDNPAWKPDFRLVVACGEKKEACGIAWKELSDARSQGRVSGLALAGNAGEIEEPANWLRWKQDSGVYEVKASSWHFQTTVRYRIENDAPLLVAYQDVDVGRAFTYAMGAAIFMMVGLYLRKLRG
ncbi:MAG TPA: hypothetical protein PKD04_00765 [Rhodocyclaceae bacterium]|jgi:hypothetical protein|nr:hypothetical protein [Rhodocyclaceae bacterium]HMV21355.1 hypothetical protein [Rhodocyclaceae bacterium]HNE44154.1 hypothetical protein [Rhodocyclaceae bacterium]HNL21638.1 hypothetical protein [Rhodocyclaceae bacterium]HNM21210.1 hypothetical protein [Rhodocyclaceae bacterium]